MAAQERRKIKVVMFPDSQVLDISGPVTVFEGANKLLPPALGYDVSLISPGGGPVATNGCIAIQAHGSVESEDLEGVDTLLIPGGSKGTPQAMRDPALRRLVRRANDKQIRLMSICTGAFVLAEAGILDNRQCTTHWAEIGNFRRLFPGVTVLTDVIYHTEDNIWTSAGVATGIDMALAIVAEDFGQDISQQVARNLVLYMARPGHLEQISEFLRNVPTQEEKFNELVMYIRTNPAANHDVNRMAERCNMSTRSFTRKFKTALGKTPAAMVREIRAARAEFYMKNTDYNQKRIAALAGFSSVDVMRHCMKAVQKDGAAAESG
ncbi:GlxA family transcriptional regulator [Leisingera methylohalidivorans]|nr:DJ-1/PfpI family protein [Leisingera methylohalidivorans]